MTRNKLLALGVVSATALALVFSPVGQVVSQSIDQVFVTNFPSPQTIEGEVEIRGAVRLSEFRAFRDLVVPPVKPSETTRLVDAGILTTEGFPNVVLSLHGVVRGTVVKEGAVGAILLPQQETIDEAFREQGLMHFALETFASGINSTTPYFASAQPRYTVGFGTYRVLLYNTTDKTVTANLFAYLTN